MLIRKLALLGLAVLAVCAMAASTASATTITSGGAAYTGTIVGTNIGTTPTLESSWGTIDCPSSVIHGHVTSTGHGQITSATWHGCTQFGASCQTPGQPAGTIVGSGLPWTVTSAFDLAHTGNRDGTMTVDDPTVVITCAGLTCRFTNTSVTGNLYNDTNANRPVSTNARSQAQFSVNLPQEGSVFGCPSTSTWTGTYQFETPSGGTITIGA